MTLRRIIIGRHATAWIVLVACLVAPAIAVAQSGESKPPPPTKEKESEKDRAGKDGKASPPGAAKPDPRTGSRGEERIRLDAPVSFPVDI